VQLQLIGARIRVIGTETKDLRIGGALAGVGRREVPRAGVLVSEAGSRLLRRPELADLHDREPADGDPPDTPYSLAGSARSRVG